MNHRVQHWVNWVSERNSLKQQTDAEVARTEPDDSPFGLVGPPVTIKVNSYVHRPNGVAITLPNRLTVSIQWGVGNYCSRRGEDATLDDQHDPAGSVDAEVAIWNKDDEWYRLSEHDEVIGWQSVAEVEDLLDRAYKDTNFAPLYEAEMARIRDDDMQDGE
jgi:hypothetical protein